MSTYNKNNPFLSSIKERFSLTSKESSKDIHHLVLDLSGSNIQYNVGDSIGIFPVNPPSKVLRTLSALKLEGNEKIEKNGVFYSLQDFLAHKANISQISRKWIAETAAKQKNLSKQTALQELLKEEHKETLKQFLEIYEIHEFIEIHSEVTFSPDELANLFMPLLPRFYSIASSQKMVGDEAHLTVAKVHYDIEGKERSGVCTHYLCQQAEMNKKSLQIYIQPSHNFSLPQNRDAHLIMIGPGTGIAPFRGFMQERLALKSQGKNWLFFGERNKKHDFLYEHFWLELERKGHLKLTTAFSRDQQNKIYVQHRMKEQSKELFKWLEEGAFFYVCGDAKEMAKDVEHALLEIIQTEGKMSDLEAKSYIKNLRSEKRYCKDVY